MRRWLVRGGVVVLGFLVGAGAVLAFQQAPFRPDAAPSPAERAAGSAPTPDPSPAPSPFAKAGPAPQPAQRLLLAWTSGGLPERFADDVAALPGVAQVTEVRGGLLELAGSRDADGTPVDDLDDGWVIPLDTIAVDPATYTPFVPKSALPAFADLDEGEALLSETGAALRGLEEGARLELADGPTLTVAGVVDDAHAAGAEVAVSAATAAGTPAEAPRYVLLTHVGDRAEVEQALRALLPDGPPLRLRGPGETPVLRHGDAVLTQAQVKERFGEFAYRRGPGRVIEPDPGWVEAHIDTATVAILGTVRCHRAILPALAGALAELEREHLAHTLDRDGYAGCYQPRFVSSLESVSRHAWGIALDVNVPDNPVGQASVQDPRLVETFERWGLGWGGQWLVPDPAHFEYLRPPAPQAQPPGE